MGKVGCRDSRSKESSEGMAWNIRNCWSCSSCLWWSCSQIQRKQAKLNFPERVQGTASEFGYLTNQYMSSSSTNSNPIAPHLTTQETYSPSHFQYAQQQFVSGGSNSFSNQDMLRFYGGDNMFVSSQQSASSSSSTALSQQQQEELLKFSMQFGGSSHSNHSGNWRGGHWRGYDIWMFVPQQLYGCLSRNNSRFLIILDPYLFDS